MIFFAILAILLVIATYVFVILLAAACVVLPYLLLENSESAPMQLVLLQLFGVVIAGGLLWSLVPRADQFQAPGPVLTREQHPRLFTEMESIASSLNEPLPSEVYLIGEVNAWVADRGGVMGFGSRRVMAVGLPLLSVLTVSQFRAVLAHEFAHYYGGDTSLGPWVYKTKMAMIRSFRAVGSMGQLARFYVLAAMHLVVTLIMKGYFMVFMRAISLISRRQEHRADELACRVAGSQPLIDGLRTIHGTGPAWPFYWTSEVSPFLNNGVVPELGDGFRRFVNTPAIAKKIGENVTREMIEGKVGPYDTHPPLRERIAATQEMERKNGIQTSRAEDNQLASSLLDHPHDAESGFIYALNPSVARGSLRFVEWDQIATQVTIPGWKTTAEEYGDAFEGVTLENIPDAIPKLRDVGAKIADPPGMLLSQDQRTARAGHVLAVGAALVLLGNGWEVQLAPGLFTFQKQGVELNPFEAVQRLVDGTLSREAWTTRCREIGLSDQVLFPVVADQVTPTENAADQKIRA